MKGVANAELIGMDAIEIEQRVDADGQDAGDHGSQRCAENTQRRQAQLAED